MREKQLYISRERFAEFLQSEIDKRGGERGEVAEQMVAGGCYPYRNSAMACINSILSGISSHHDRHAGTNRAIERRLVSLSVADRITTALDRNDVWHVEFADIEFVTHLSSDWSKTEVIAAARRWNKKHGQPPLASEWNGSCEDHPGRTLVWRVFGGWNAMIKAAGLPIARPNREPIWTKESVADAFIVFYKQEGRWPTAKDWRVPKNGDDRPSARTVRNFCGSWPAAQKLAEETSGLVAA